MPISEAHSAAARENSAKSTGPVTPEGKAKSSQNARKLGLFGPLHFLDDQEEQAYNELLEGYLGELRPQSILEHRYVREMVNAEWRLSLLRDTMIGYEINHIDQPTPSAREGRAGAFAKMAQAGEALSLALRYEKHFQRQFEKSHQAFLAARRQRHTEAKAEFRRQDQVMVNVLKSIAEAPIPGFSEMHNKNVQNEAKPTPPFNPAIHTKAAPNTTIPNLFKG